ncbi:MAG: hypothetical protein WC155_11010 [Candidatus Cloacimonadales bacterium]
MKRLLVIMLILVAVGVVSAYSVIIDTDVPLYGLEWYYKSTTSPMWTRTPYHDIAVLESGIHIEEFNPKMYYRVIFHYFDERVSRIIYKDCFCDLVNNDTVTITIRGKLQNNPIDPGNPIGY